MRFHNRSLKVFENRSIYILTPSSLFKNINIWIMSVTDVGIDFFQSCSTDDPKLLWVTSTLHNALKLVFAHRLRFTQFQLFHFHFNNIWILRFLRPKYFAERYWHLYICCRLPFHLTQYFGKISGSLQFHVWSCTHPIETHSSIFSLLVFWMTYFTTKTLKIQSCFTMLDLFEFLYQFRKLHHVMILSTF